jgi:putative hydrolase of the HAD superfamily
MEMPVLRAILFDLDDTLLVDEAVSYEALETVAQQAEEKFHIDPKLFVHDTATIAQELWRAGDCYPFCRAIGISAFEGLWGKFLGDTKELSKLRTWSQQYRQEVFEKALLAQHIEHSPAEAAARVLAQEFSLLRRQRQRLFPEAREVLEKLSQRYRLGLLTNGAPDLQREKIVASSCEDLFSAIVISGEHGIGKPEPAIFEHLLQELGVTADEVIMVGNSLERDIAGARAAGIYSIWLRLASEEKIPEGIIPDQIITDLRELLYFCEIAVDN